MGSQDDDNGLVLGLVFGLITLVIALVIGIGALRGITKPVKVQATVAAAAADADASVQVEGGLVTFFFASGKATLAGGANEALAGLCARCPLRRDRSHHLQVEKA